MPEGLLLLSTLTALYIAWSIGANDETMANLAGSRFVSVTAAVLLGAVMDFLGAVLLGHKVEETLGHELLRSPVTEVDAFVVVLSVAIWLTAASWYGWPISTTHSVVGACIGVGVVKSGLFGVNWWTLSKIAAAWVLSPLAGLASTVVVLKGLSSIVNRCARGLVRRVRVTYISAYLLLIWSCLSAFSRGANDIANATAFLAVIHGNPALVRAVCGLGMALGLVTIGRRVIRSVGFSLSSLDPFAALVVQMSVALTMLIGTLAKLPLSGTHILVGSIIGVGLARGVWIDVGNVRRIFLMWALTFPATMVTAAALSLVASAVT